MLLHTRCELEILSSVKEFGSQEMSKNQGMIRVSSDSNKRLDGKPRAVAQCYQCGFECVDMCRANSRGLLGFTPFFLDLFMFFIY